MKNEEIHDEAAKKLQEVSDSTNYYNTLNRQHHRPNFAANGLKQLTNDKNNLLNKRNNPLNHQKPNMSENPDNPNSINNPGSTPVLPNKNNDVGSQNLQKSLAKKAGNLWNSRKKRKKEKKKQNNEGQQDNSNNSNDNTSSPLDELSENIQRIRRIRLIIKITIIAVIIFMIIVVILSIIMAFTGVNLAKSIPAIGVSTYESDNFQAVYEEGSKEYENEINYYKKLKEVKEEYEEGHSDELKTGYIHAILLYKYYQIETDDRGSDGQFIPVDYAKLTPMIDTVYELMKPTEDMDIIDYEKKGKFYNNVLASNEIRDYYKDLLQENNNNFEEILDNIFDFAKEVDEFEIADNTVITDETKVTVIESKDEPKSKAKTMPMSEYISSSIYATTSNLDNSEMIKAYTIAYSTNIIAKNKKLTVDANNASMIGTVCSVNEGCSYDSNGKLVSGPGERTSQNSMYYNGGYYYHRPLSSSESSSLTKSINNVYGNVLVSSDGTYPTLDLDKLGGLGDYKTILKSSYGDYTIKNIGENSYILDGSYGDKKVLTKVVFYDQGDYVSNSFCGLKNETIKSSGCGVTSMAMLTSTYENNNKYTPLYMNNEATKKGLCGAGSGTSQSFFGKEAATLNYKYLGGGKYDKSLLNMVLKHLSQGHLVIVRIGPGHFTGGGHYMVLGGVDPETKKVYVYDPNNASNVKYRKTGNGWYSFNDIIVKEAYNFYIIWKG